MDRTVINYENYKVKAFLDSNIILECLPLVDLPWKEIDAEGPILALLTPTAIKEIDSKKQDGRLGKRAREFNRLIASVATGGPPIVICEKAPRVELALSRHTLIPWAQHDELDPSDGDSCIVAEILHSKGINTEEVLLVSHDIKPIIFASYYDVPTLHISDTWLRQPEPHPKDREIQKLNSRIAQYEATEPAFQIIVELLEPGVIELVHIEDLTEEESTDIQARLIAMNPRENQDRGGLGRLNLGTYDSSYDKRFDDYLKHIPIFMANYVRIMEWLFNQARFKLSIVNTSQVQAENILVEVKITNGRVHDHFVFASPRGPRTPRPDLRPFPWAENIGRDIPLRVGRHEYEYKQEPNYGRRFSITCEDFRQGQEYVFEGIVSMDARIDETTKITVSVTASNLSGTINETKIIERKIDKLHISKLINLKTLQLTADLPMKELLTKKNYKMIDWNVLENTVF